MIYNLITRTTGLLLCFCLSYSVSIAQTPTSLTVKKESDMMDKRTKMVDGHHISDKDLGAIWTAVESTERVRKNDELDAGTADCEKLRVDVSEAKDLVINTKPNMRQDALLSYFDKKRLEAICYKPKGGVSGTLTKEEVRMQKCLVAYSSWSDDPLRELLPKHIIVSDLEAFNAYWMESHNGEKSPCQKQDLWATQPRVKMIAPSSKSKTAPIPR